METGNSNKKVGREGPVSEAALLDCKRINHKSHNSLENLPYFVK
jgi:hypothetical protein